MSTSLEQSVGRRWRNVFGFHRRSNDRAPAHAANADQKKPYILPPHVKIGTVAGSMKSGTTWLMNLLDDHPQVLSRGEMHLLGEMPVNDPVIHSLLSHYPAQWPTFQQILRHSHEFTTWLLKGNDFWNEAYRRDPQPVLEALQTDILRFVFEWKTSYVMRTAADKDIRWIVDKSPIHYTDYYELFNQCFAAYSRAIIHLVRDPREVALSLWYHLRTHIHYADMQQRPESLPPEDRQACQELFTLEESQLTRERHFFTVPNFLRLTLRHWTEVNAKLYEAGKRGDCPYLLVHYRDLKRDKPGTLARILDFLGLSFDSRLLGDYGKPVTSDGKPRGSTFRKGSLGEWRKWFIAEDHAAVREECGDLMRTFGYGD